MAVKNLVSGVLAESITTSTTNILVHIADNISAQGILDFFPNPPFYITIMPKAPAIGVSNRLDSEIIKITNVGHDQVGNAALTGVRAQRDTTAKAFSTGDIVTAAIYTEDLAGAYSNATTTTAGLMSPSDKKKLDGLSAKVLYDNMAGTMSNFTLTESVDDYDFLDVFYYSANAGNCSTRVCKGQYSDIACQATGLATINPIAQTQFARLSISGTSVTVSKRYFVNMYPDPRIDIRESDSRDSSLLFKKVIGYKYNEI